MRDHCPACRAAREIREHRDKTYDHWSTRKGALSFAALVADQSCPDYRAICGGRDPAYQGVCQMRKGHPAGCFDDPWTDA